MLFLFFVCLFVFFACVYVFCFVVFNFTQFVILENVSILYLALTGLKGLTGSLRKPRRQCHVRHHQEIALMKKTMKLHVKIQCA